MNPGLRELLGLPATTQNGAARDGAFRQEFREGIAGLNGDLQMLAAQGDSTAHGKLASQRQTLYAAYHTAASQNDPAGNQRVIAAVAKTRESASAQKATTLAGREEWLKREADFDAAVVKIGELEDAGHPKAATYRTLSDKVLAQANAHDYQQASNIFDQLGPKVADAHVVHMNTAGTQAQGGSRAPGGGGNVPGGGGGGKGGDPPQESKAYKGHRPPPADVYVRKTTYANKDMVNGISKSRDSLGKPYTHPDSVWNDKLSDGLKERLNQFADPTNKTGKSLKKVDLTGKSALQLHNELIAQGFEYHREPLSVGKDAEGKPKYRLRDGSTTLDATHKDIVPQDFYVHPDGGMVRVKPEGNPGDKFRPEPNASKSVLFDSTKGTGFDNEAFKVSNEGHAVPKDTRSDSGMKQAPRGSHSASENIGFKDGTMNWAHTNLPRTTQGVPPQLPPSSTPHTPSGTVNVKTAEAFINDAKSHKAMADEIEKKGSKGGSHDPSKLTKQTQSLEGTADSLAKQFESHPDFKDVRGGSTRKFFQGVKARYAGVGVKGGIVLLALNVADAYELVQAVRHILDSKSVDEALRKSFALGKEVAKGAIEFGVLRFAVRSTPVAVGITVFLGDLDKNGRMTPREIFAREVMKVVNKVSPGAVERLGHMGTTDIFRDANAEKLFRDALVQATNMLKDNMAKEPRQIGYYDGLTGSKTKTDFEVSSQEKSILRIDEKWLEGVYRAGVENGKKRRLEAIQRAKAEGQEDGKNGKPANPERLNYWYEVKHVLKRIDNTKGDERLDSMAVLSEYYDSYKKGYEAGRKSFQTATITKLEITPQSFSLGAHSTRRLIATGTFSDGKTIDLTDLVKWSSDKTDVVSVDDKNEWSGNMGRKLDGKYAFLRKIGKAVITATYSASNGSPPPAKITITVTEPKYYIKSKMPGVYPGPDGKYMINVDAKDVRFGVAVWSDGHEDEVAEFLFDWKITPSDVASPGINWGQVVLHKEGEATITATNKDTKISAVAKISVEPKGTIILGGQKLERIRVKR